MANSKIKLTYFDLHGRAEVIQLVLTWADKEFEDFCVPRDQWPKYKLQEAPFGKVPYVEIDGKIFAQSLAIAQYFASEFNLYGKTNLDRLKIDQFGQLVEDLFKEALKASLEQDQVKKAEIVKNLKEELAPKFLANAEKLLNGNTGQHFVGDGVTLADLIAYDAATGFLKTYLQKSLDKFPLFKALVTRIGSNERIEAYTEDRSNLKCGINPGRHFMTYSGVQFENYVTDTFTHFTVMFKNDIPDVYNNFIDLTNVIKELQIKSLVPKITVEGKINQTCTIGIAVLDKVGELERIRGVWQIAHGAYVTLPKNKKPVVNIYHAAQGELLSLLGCTNNCDMTNTKATNRFVNEIYVKSCSILKAFATQPKDDVFNKKIELCFKVLVLRLWVHQHSMKDDNDFMDDKGWRNWQRHTLVNGSFAVLYLCLQLVHKKQNRKPYLPRKKTSHFSKKAIVKLLQKNYLGISALIGVPVIGFFLYKVKVM